MAIINKLILILT